MKFQDSEFMTAEEKQLVLKQWRTFLKHGCKFEHFTDRLYKHLTLHCSFIAHYDRGGFYADYFVSGDARAEFLSQFDRRKGTQVRIYGSVEIAPHSIEFGGTSWLIGGQPGDYIDINLAMIEVATEYIPALLKEGASQQREADIAEAKALLDKHNLSAEDLLFYLEPEGGELT